MSDQQPSAPSAEDLTEKIAALYWANPTLSIRDATTPIIQAALSETRRKAYEDAARLVCCGCYGGNPATLSPSKIGPLFWHSEPSHMCLAGGIWRRLAKGSTGEGERND